jgi:YesN/AraC family two-component response regulator
MTIEKKQKPRRILFIDDDPGVRKLFTKIMSEKEYEIIMAVNGKEGLALYQEHFPDLVITDIIMPEKEGIETIIELKEQFPDVKIIVISGGGSNDPETYLHIAKGFGVLRTFTKPIDWQELLKAIDEILS